jgi:4-amino-4-deoxy-L-arabinose transferase-like glycosyltransferase
VSVRARQREQALLLAACLLTAALPLGRFDQSLWRDEATSVWFARLPLRTLLTSLCDPHPPGYYLILKTWQVGGESEFWLRLPSLLAAILAVPLTYRLGRESFGHRTGWLAALLLALHPLQSWYAGEVRMYAMAQVLSLLLVLLGWHLLSESARRPHFWRNATAYGLVALFALGIDYSILLTVGLLQLLWLARGCPRVWRWLITQAAVLLAAGLLWLNANQLLALRQNYISVLIAVQAYRLGLNVTPSGAARLMQLVVIGLVLVSLALAWSWPRRPDHRLDHPLAQSLLAGAWLSLLLLAALPRAFTVKRQLVVLLPYLALLTGYVLAKFPRPTGELVAGLGLSVTLLALPSHQREPWRAVVTDLVQTELDQSAVIWVDDLSATVFDYYLRHGKVEADQVLWTPLFGRDLPQLPNLTPQPGDTLWIVISESVYRHLTAQLPRDFYRRYQLQEERHAAGIGLYRYQRRVEPLPGRPQLSAPDHHLDAWGLLLPSPLDTCRLR